MLPFPASSARTCRRQRDGPAGRTGRRSGARTRTRDAATIKVKVGDDQSMDRVAAVRAACGPGVRIRSRCQRVVGCRDRAADAGAPRALRHRADRGPGRVAGGTRDATRPRSMPVAAEVVHPDDRRRASSARARSRGRRSSSSRSASAACARRCVQQMRREFPQLRRAPWRRRSDSPPSSRLLPRSLMRRSRTASALRCCSNPMSSQIHLIAGRRLADPAPSGGGPATPGHDMTRADEGDVALSYVTTLLDELVDGGVAHMCMTPGSRSTPIALAAARHPGITLHVHVDERSSAFFGLGIAAASGQPVAMFCTSGTAAANHLPAVIEASLSRVPIIVHDRGPPSRTSRCRRQSDDRPAEPLRGLRQMVLRHRRTGIRTARAAPLVVRRATNDPACGAVPAARTGPSEPAVSGAADAERSAVGCTAGDARGLHDHPAWIRPDAGVSARGQHRPSRRRRCRPSPKAARRH